MEAARAAAFDTQRPPVTPGRELGGSSGPPPPPGPASCGSSAVGSDRVNTPPLPLPRRSQLDRRSSTDGFAPLGFEPEGGSGGSSSPSPSPGGGGEALSASPPNYLEWAKSFSHLLKDQEGLALFRRYLAAENQADLLEFWFACEGLKKQSNQEQINLIVKCIYRRYFKDSRLGLSDQCLSSVLDDIRMASRTSPNLSSAIFASSQQEVERIINVVVYRNFLQSDIYLNYIHHMTQDSCSGSTTGSSSGGGGGCHSTSEPPPGTPLPLVKTSGGAHEPDGRAASYTTHCSSAGGPPTTMSSQVPPPSETKNSHTGSFFPTDNRLAGTPRASSVPNDSTQTIASSSVSSPCDVMSKSAPNPSSLHLLSDASGNFPPSGNFHRAGNFPGRGGAHSPKPPTSPAPLDMVSDTLQSLTEELASSLPTLHEDEFFDFRSRPLPPGQAAAPQAPKLTKDSLLATARKRTNMRPKPETFAGMFLKHGAPRPNPYSLAYNSYNPVSRHDSDIQSLSSDARSGSDLSLNTSGVGGPNTLNRPSKHAGASSGGGGGHGGSHSHPPKPRSIMNREEDLHNTIIPRTQQKPKVSTMKPKEFADLLITKLSVVKRDRDTDERLLRSLNEGPLGDPSTGGLSTALSERFPLCAEDDQDILDQHIESVFDKIGLSPGFTTPSRPKSPAAEPPPPRLPPHHKGTASAPALPPPPLLPKLMGPPPPPHPSHPHHHQVPMSRLDYLKHHKTHRDRDGNFSMFTSDSGNVHDMTDGTETLLSYGNSSSGCYGNPNNYAGGNSSLGGASLPKSKSMPDYGGSYGDQSLASCSRQGSRRYIAKRSDSQIFDSGISGISCSTNATPAPPAPALVSSEQPEYLKNRNVAQWLMESSASSTPLPLPDTKTTSSSSCTRLRHTTSVKHKSGSRSCSSERPGPGVGGAGAGAKMHPYVTDPSMPPLNPPHTFTQLEEVSRRLLEKDTRPIQSRFKPPTPGANKSQETGGGPPPPAHPMGGRPVAAGSHLPPPGGPFTTVVFTFCEEQYPYRTKIPSSPVTLKQFKDYLPKKGNYRFFFKTECDDVDTKVIQEEIVDDNEVLPLWEGKVMGQVKPLENENMGHY